MNRLKVLSGLFVALWMAIAFPLSATPDTDQPKPLKIGMLLTLSGSYAIAGNDCRLGVNAALAVADAKSRFDVIFADSEADPSTAMSEFRKLTDVDGVLAVYTHRSNIGMAINPVSQKSGVPLLGAVGNKDFAKNNVFAFQVWPKSDDEGDFFAEELFRRGYRRAAIITAQDEWTSSIADAFRKRFTSLGGTLVYDESFLPTETDFRTSIAQLKTKSPEAVFINALLPQIGPIIRQARNINVPGVLFSNFYTAKKDVLDAAGASALEGVRYVDVDADLPALRANLNSEAPPTGLTLASYLATLLLAQAASENTSVHSSKEFYSAILKQREIRTPDRNFAIQDRYVKIPLVVKVIHDGRGSIEDTKGP